MHRFHYTSIGFVEFSHNLHIRAAPLQDYITKQDNLNENFHLHKTHIVSGC